MYENLFCFKKWCLKANRFKTRKLFEIVSLYLDSDSSSCDESRRSLIQSSGLVFISRFQSSYTPLVSGPGAAGSVKLNHKTRWSQANESYFIVEGGGVKMIRTGKYLNVATNLICSF